MKAIKVTFSGKQFTATDSDGNRAVCYESGEDQHEDCYAKAALALCEKMGWEGDLIKGGLGNAVRVFVFDDARERVRNPTKWVTAWLQYGNPPGPFLTVHARANTRRTLIMHRGDVYKIVAGHIVDSDHVRVPVTFGS